jgi:hypothetical protein
VTASDSLSPFGCGTGAIACTGRIDSMILMNIKMFLIIFSALTPTLLFAQYRDGKL